MGQKLSTQYLFLGSGEIAKHVRSQNWSHTPLGEIATWPAELKTTLNVLLHADIPMICVWGSDRRVFLNDATATLLNQRDRQALLGASLQGQLATRWKSLITSVEGVFTSGQPVTGKNPLKLAATKTANPNYTWTLNAIWNTVGEVEGVLVTGVPQMPKPAAHATSPQRTTASQDRATLFHRIADSSPIIIWMSDTSGAGIWFNQRWCEFTGQTLEAALGDGWLAALHPDDTALVEFVCAESHRKLETVHLEYRLCCADGHYRWVIDSAVPWFDEAGVYQGYIGSMIDISDRKQAEADLRESEELKQSILDSSSDCIKVLDLAGKLQYMNQGGLSTIEVDDPICILDKHWIDFWQGDDRAAAQAVLAAARAGQLGRMQGYCPTQTGKPKWWDVIATPLRDPTGTVNKLVVISRDITEQKQAEAAWRESEAQLATELADMNQLQHISSRLIQEDDIDLIYEQILDAAIALMRSDMGSLQMLDFERHELQLLSWKGFDPTSAEFWAWVSMEANSVCSEALKREERIIVPDIQTCEFMASTEDQHFLHLSGIQAVQTTPLISRHGQVIGMISTHWRELHQPSERELRLLDVLARQAADLLDRKQAEADLRESEERLRMAQQAAGAGLWDWDMVNNRVTWSDEYYQLYGIDKSILPSYDNWLASILPVDQQRVDGETRRTVEQGENLKVEFRITHPDDGLRWLLAIGQTFYDTDGHPARMTGIALNITEQKRFEQALLESEAIARIRAEEISILMETAPAAIWIAHDPHCQQITANNMAYELMGMAPGSSTPTLVGGESPLPCKLLQNGHELLPDDLPMQKAIRLQQEVTEEIEFVFPDGTIRCIYGKAVPLYDALGAVRGAIAGFSEITTLKNIEQEREQLLQRERMAREAAEQANRLKDQFLAVLSHELRSPLNPILGWSKLLQTHTLDPVKTAKALETIERNARLQSQLVDDLLDLSRILRGKLFLESSVVNLGSVIEAAMDTVRTTAAAKSISLRLDLDTHAQVLGDTARLQQVVWNLLSNAIKFTPTRGLVEVYLKRVGDQIQIIVQDNGIGINPDFLPYIFESFRQEDVSITRKHGGLGLGLAIVRQLVEAHGGTVFADSPGEGLGTTFTVQLPELVVETTAPSVTNLPQQDFDLTGMRILAVDDSADTRELLAALLEQFGAEVVAVDSAFAALRMLDILQPDILISDIGMPEMDGYSLIRQIRERPPEKGGQLPAIALTAYVQTEDEKYALANGYQRHLAKPLDVEKLIRAVLSLAPKP